MQASPELNDALVRLADSLGVAVSQLWTVARTMPAYQALLWVPWIALWGALAAVAWWVVVPRWRRRYEAATKDGEKYYGRPGEWEWTMTVTAQYIAAAFAVITAGCTVMAASHAIGLVNPDAYALEYIARMVRR